MEEKKAGKHRKHKLVGFSSQRQKEHCLEAVQWFSGTTYIPMGSENGGWGTLRVQAGEFGLGPSEMEATQKF